MSLKLVPVAIFSAAPIASASRWMAFQFSRSGASSGKLASANAADFNGENILPNKLIGAIKVEWSDNCRQKLKRALPRGKT